MMPWSGYGSLEITAPRNSISENVFTFSHTLIGAENLLPTNPYMNPIINFIYGAEELKTTNLVITDKLSLSVPPTMTYTTMTASTSTQVGYIISATSTATTALTTFFLSSYICSFQSPIGIYQFNCYIAIPSKTTEVSINAGIYIDALELHSVNSTTTLFHSLTFSFSYRNFTNNNF